MNKQEMDVLGFLEKNSRLSVKDLAVMTGETEEKTEDMLTRLEQNRVICGYNTLINWDKTDKETVTALIEIKVSPQRGRGFDTVAERIWGFDEVNALYLMSGGFDLTVIVEGRTIKEVAYFVSDKLAPMEDVISTATHFVLKKYKDHGIIIEEKSEEDDRLIVSP